MVAGVMLLHPSAFLIFQEPEFGQIFATAGGTVEDYVSVRSGIRAQAVLNTVWLLVAFPVSLCLFAGLAKVRLFLLFTPHLLD